MSWTKVRSLATVVLALVLAATAAARDETFDRALSLAAEERYAEAREQLAPFLQRNPGHPRARLLHGILNARTGKVSDAIDVFRALLEDYPDMFEPYNNLAVLYAVQGRLDERGRLCSPRWSTSLRPSCTRTSVTSIAISPAVPI